MPALLVIPNFESINIVDQTVTTQSVAVAATSITIQNSKNFVVGSFVVIGDGEQIDIKTLITGTTGLTLAFNALTYAHKKSERVRVLQGNSIRIYRADNVDGTPPAQSVYTRINTIGIQEDKEYTQYQDIGGGVNTWYKFTYYNTTTQYETDPNYSVPIRGGGYGAMASVDDIRKEAGLENNTYVTDIQIDFRRNEVQNYVNSYLKNLGYIVPLQNSSGTLFTPPIIENVVMLMTAGYLLIRDYGVTVSNDTKEGDQKILAAKAILQDLTDRKIVLLDASGDTLSRTAGVSGYPDDSTAAQGPNGLPEPRLFIMNKTF